MHPSVLEEGDSLKCTVSPSGFGCPLCPLFRTKSWRVIERHFSNHVANAVHFNEKIICRCNLQCRNGGHFHCAFCAMTIIRKDTIATHLTECQSKTCDVGHIFSVSETTHPAVLSSVERSFSVPPSVSVIEMDHSYTAASSKTPAVAPAEPEEPQSPRATTSEELIAPEEPVTGDVPPTHVKCPHCPVVLYKRNLLLHVQRKHGNATDVTAQSHLQSTLVHPSNGLYAVQKTSRGFGVPVHVQRTTWGQQHVLRCEMEDCWEHYLLAQRSGLSPSLCRHIRSLDYCDAAASEDQLDHRVLQEMVERFFLDDSQAAMCKARQRVADEARVPLSVLVDLTGSKTHICLSIHEPKLRHYSTLGRVFVTHNTEEDTWNCPCIEAHASCAHKCIAKWHLFQTHKHLFQTVPPTDQSAKTTPSVGHPTAECEVCL